MIGRRELLGTLALGAAGLSLAACGSGAKPSTAVPSFLRGHEKLYRKDPRAAFLEWFRAAKFGLFVHDGVYSRLGRGEWVQWEEKIPVAEYGKLKESFHADKFDADAIAELAAAAGMKYINLTARHHDSFCLFRTNGTSFNSVNSPSTRDLLGEMAAACEKRGLGLFVYYSYAQDWRHPYFFPREAGGSICPYARPGYAEPQPEYLYQKEEDFFQYIKFAHSQLEEILYRYQPLAGLWLAPEAGYYCRPDLFPIGLTYEVIRTARPDVLLSFGQGASGDEDFVAREHPLPVEPRGGELGRAALRKNQSKPIEIRDSLQPGAWGYDERSEGKHKTADDVMRMLEDANKENANLLLNTGLLPDGSVHPSDVATLLGVGKRRGVGT